MLEKIACLLALAATRNRPSFAIECLQYDVKPKQKLNMRGTKAGLMGGPTT